MGHNGLVQRFDQQHGLPHHLPGLDAPPVVGEASYMGSHSRQVRQILALFTPGDGAVGIHMDSGVFPNEVQLYLQIRCVVGDGLQIGHGAHGGIAACGGSRRAGKNGLLIRKPRLPKMNVDIDETWNDQMVM